MISAENVAYTRGLYYTREIVQKVDSKFDVISLRYISKLSNTFSYDTI